MEESLEIYKKIFKEKTIKIKCFRNILTNNDYLQGTGKKEKNL